MNENRIKIKVGTLTFHIAHNYGAVLQAYALPKAVQSLGYECEVIHYCFPYIYWWGHVERLQELIIKHGYIGGTLRFIKRSLKGAYNPRSKQKKFEYFIHHVVPISAYQYHDVGELENMDYDVILFGSDQIWNSQLTNGIAKEYVGGFKCLDKTKKIAYAASCGRSSFTEEEKKNYYPLLEAFHSIGVREKGLCESLCRDGFNAEQVLDPTLLLTKDQWNELTKTSKHGVKLPKKGYLLVYVFDEDNSIYQFIDKVADKYDLEVCVIAYHMKPAIEKYNVYRNCGPSDFVRLFAGASRVVTTSFHGTVFSILYEKDFYCVPHPTLHERTDSLLSALNLSDRNCSSETKIDEKDMINWDEVEHRLDALREDSLRFLKEAIE